MSKKVKIIIAVIVLAVIAGTCFYFFYWKPKQEEKPKVDTPKAAPKDSVKTNPLIKTSNSDALSVTEALV